MRIEHRGNYWTALVLVSLVVVCCFSLAGATQMSIPVPNSTLANTSQTVVTMATEPVIQQKPISSEIEEKISTNLLYLIDSNLPVTGLSRNTVLNQMQVEGKFITGTQLESSNETGHSPESATTTQSGNLVLAYIDLVPTTTTSAVDPYVSTVIESNDNDHYVVAWVNINNLDTLAALYAVSYIQSAEPSVTNSSPIYHDTKFVDDRSGLPPATAEEAKASVRTFENSPGMIFEQKRTITTPRGVDYDIASDGGRYFVNANTGAVEVAVFFDTQKSSNQQLVQSDSTRPVNTSNTTQITMDEAFGIALNYAGKNYKNFDNRTMVLTQDRLVDHGTAGNTYYFTWMEKINNIFTPNMVDISINPENGEIISYIGIDQPFNVDIVPTISKDLAISKAVGAFSPIVVEGTDSKLVVAPIDQNNQRLIWLITVKGVPKDDIDTGGEVQIDAHSGEIVQVNPIN